jgi:hypothetical protein
MSPKFDHTSVVNGLTIAHHSSWGVSGKNLTFNDCAIKGLFGSHPTMAQSIAFNNCTAPDASMEVDKLLTSVTFTDCTWGTMYFQSANSVRLATLDNTDVTSIVGNPWKLVVQNGCTIGSWQCGTASYGCPNELVVSDSTITAFTTPGRFIQALDNAGSGGIQPDGTMTGGVITIPAAKNYWPGQWTVTGSRVFFYAEGAGTIGLFTVTDVAKNGSGDLLITTDWPSGIFPPRTYTSNGLWLQTHDAPICNFTSVTGDADVVDLSGAPDGAPMWSYTKRTYDKSLVAASPSVTVTGKIRKIVFNVITAYAGATTPVAVTVFPGWGMTMAGLGQTDLSFVVNLKVAGIRELDVTADTYPASWTGAQTGDTLPALAAATWLGGNCFVTPQHDVSAEATSLSFSLEVICDHGF